MHVHAQTSQICAAYLLTMMLLYQGKLQKCIQRQYKLNQFNAETYESVFYYLIEVHKFCVQSRDWFINPMFISPVDHNGEISRD